MVIFRIVLGSGGVIIFGIAIAVVLVVESVVVVVVVVGSFIIICGTRGVVVVDIMKLCTD